MHARSVIAKYRFWHEGDGFAVAVGHVLNHVFVFLNVIARQRQRAEIKAQLVLAWCHFVVVQHGGDAHFRKRGEHFAANILRRINRSHGEIAAFNAGAVTQVAVRIFFGRVGWVLFAFQRVGSAEHVGIEGHGIEHEEFQLGAEISSVANAGIFQIGFGFFCGTAWVTTV